MSDRGGKTDVRWSSEEWAALERLAVASGLTPGKVVKEIVRRAVLLPVAAGSEVAGLGELVGRREVLHPVESAGSVGPVPPAGVAAAGDAPSPAAAPVSGAVGAVKLERAVAAALTARFGQRVGLLAMARRDVRAGKVRVDGVVCIDPERLVDPGALGS